MQKQRTRKLKRGEIIPISFDFMFSEIFNDKDNIDIIENFISSYFDLEINKVRGNIKILSRKQGIENKKEKNKEIDLLLEYDGKKINIEMNNELRQGIVDRNVVYASKVHVRNLKYAEKDYNNISKTVQINLSNKACNEEKIIETYYLRNEKGKKLTEKLQIDYIDMEKAEQFCYNKDVSERERKIARWCMILNSNTIKSLKENIGDIMSKEEKEKLVERAEELSEEDEAVYLYTKLPHEEIVKNTLASDARSEGIEEGRKEEKINTAKNMLLKGMDENLISEITDLTIIEIKELKSNTEM